MGELILILGSKIHNLLTIFCRLTKISLKIPQEIKKFDSKKFSEKIILKKCSFRALKLIFEFNVFTGYFGMFRGL